MRNLKYYRPYISIIIPYNQLYKMRNKIKYYINIKLYIDRNYINTINITIEYEKKKILEET